MLGKAALRLAHRAMSAIALSRLSIRVVALEEALTVAERDRDAAVHELRELDTSR